MAIGPGTELMGKRYLVQEEIGRGGFGVVWKGYDRRLPRPVAIKVLFRRNDDQEWAERFYQEARIAAGLGNSVTPEVHDFDQLDGEYFIVMEYLEGHDLGRELRSQPEGRLPADRAIRLVAEAAQALGKAHQQGIVHRDLKPSNLFLPASGAALKILDFGIAKILNVRLTASGGFVGTPAYSAPELFGRGPVDDRADLYSLGCVLYEMLTGRLPDRVAESARIRQQIEAAVGRPDIARPLGDLVARLLAREPAGRPRSALEVAEALRLLQPGPPLAAPARGAKGEPIGADVQPASDGTKTVTVGSGEGHDNPDASSRTGSNPRGVNRTAIAVGAAGIVAVLAAWLITASSASGTPHPTITKVVTVAPGASAAPPGAYVGTIENTDAHVTISTVIDGTDYFLQIPEQNGTVQLRPQSLSGASHNTELAQLAPSDSATSNDEILHIGVCSDNPDPYGDAFIGSAAQHISGTATTDPAALLEVLTGTDGTGRAYLTAAPGLLCSSTQASSWSFIPQGEGYWIMNDNNCLTAQVGAGQGDDTELLPCSTDANSDQVWTIIQSSK